MSSWRYTALRIIWVSFFCYLGVSCVRELANCYHNNRVGPRKNFCQAFKIKLCKIAHRTTLSKRINETFLAHLWGFLAGKKRSDQIYSSSYLILTFSEFQVRVGRSWFNAAHQHTPILPRPWWWVAKTFLLFFWLYQDLFYSFSVTGLKSKWLCWPMTATDLALASVAAVIAEPLCETSFQEELQIG